MAKDVTNRRAKEHVDEDQNGVIVAGPEAHAREHAGTDPAHKVSPSKDKSTAKSAVQPASGGKG
ncbi:MULTISPECIES: hypothetical protein [unclassified Rhizobium]|uniref:hypothetical protein n=1 Tax=unclassified Rhizobium TaxID=2613769 RepID=UPI001ADA7973|nr:MULTISPECIES: hypothetical protein [unclassified Rhizobium]MBO9126740.1 hypothetical protein [Rhizobium sp. 16-488-2b]MBO9177187.1 hypothetical protein [Rhizobium sp. 16-488-2a]